MSNKIKNSPIEGNELNLNDVLREFEAVEANLGKLERVWKELEDNIPEGIVFGNNPNYDNLCREYEEITKQLPAIDGWKTTAFPLDLNTIAQFRFDAKEIGEVESFVTVEENIELPGKEIEEYRFRFNKKRRDLVRDEVIVVFSKMDAAMMQIAKLYPDKSTESMKKTEKSWESVSEYVAQLDVLLGSGWKRPKKWGDLRRHLHFNEEVDRNDVLTTDWPSVKRNLRELLYEGRDPVNVDIEELSDLLEKKPKGPVATALKWDEPSDEEFERLIFELISDEVGYENPEWLMKTRAPDKGRDLSVTRVIDDTLAGKIRFRVIIQCKHWTDRSISIDDIATLKAQMKLWEPPRVDILIIATSGRFTSDAVDAIEKQNQSDQALRVEMWPNSHLERLLAKRPALIGEFRLR